MSEFYAIMAVFVVIGLVILAAGFFVKDQTHKGWLIAIGLFALTLVLGFILTMTFPGSRMRALMID